MPAMFLRKSQDHMEDRRVAVAICTPRGPVAGASQIARQVLNYRGSMTGSLWPELRDDSDMMIGAVSTYGASRIELRS